MQPEANERLTRAWEVASEGCAWIVALTGMVFSLFVGCAAGIAGVAILPLGSPSMPPEVDDALQGPLGPMATVYLPGGLLCGLVMLLLHYRVIYEKLPYSARGRWATVTFAGGIVYWIVAWLGHFQVLGGELFGLVTLLQQTERGTQEETIALAAITAVGFATGALSGALLGVLQWSVLREHVGWAGRWLVYVTLGSGLLVAMFFYGFYWFSRGMSWN